MRCINLLFYFIYVYIHRSFNYYVYLGQEYMYIVRYIELLYDVCDVKVCYLSISKALRISLNMSTNHAGCQFT